ncbi:hypothetical protein ROG8370_02953 [Roseovarius gaetbuli]|uniref:Tetratricopeptide repeat protein n=1 Tax=Roseovarius gaetbuli TaxID=1356575 RepID=A0A1X6ZZ56_9RHOB|nr:hypothetical protein [Roseovarius gaetbuli]SLN64023.1 hypothetical protein ROG8370_02953 [Roseovarius gaetbuli]
MTRLVAEIEAMRGLSDRIDNIVGAAAEAVQKRNLAEAREILDSAREVQKEVLRKPLEVNATLLEKTAEIDLIQGRVNDAFKILSAAADSFASINPLEPARRRVTYAIQLYNHGLRFGDPGMTLSAQMIRDALTHLDKSTAPDLWAHAQNNLAAALSTQAARTEGAAGTALLAEAVTAYRGALTVFTRQDHPVHWAMTQENLAICEVARADHDTTADPTPHLRAALEYVEAALTVFDPEHMPYDHGTATALRDQIKARLSGE